MGMSSFRLAYVGGGYWQVLIGLWLRYAFRIGPIGSFYVIIVQRRLDPAEVARVMPALKKHTSAGP